MRKKHKPITYVTERLPQNGSRYLMYISDFSITIDDEDDIGCSFDTDSRETVRKIADKVRNLDNIEIIVGRKVRWSPELLQLGFISWN